jgi:hypothetical protein
MSGPADTCDFLKTLRSGWWQLAELAASAAWCFHPGR